MFSPVYSRKERRGSVCRQVSRFRAPALLTAVFITVSLLFVQSPSRAANPTPSGWQISKTSGDVRYRLSDNPGSPWIHARAGSVITAQAQFETGSDGRATLIRDGDRIGMSPNSRILLPSAQASRKVTTIMQSIGIMLYKVKRRAKALLVGGQPAHRFEVRTPYLVTMVKGTTFAISTNSRGAAVNLIEGILDVSRPNGDVVTQILGGQIASATKAAQGAISVIKINGTGHKVFRSERALEAKATGEKASKRKSLRVANFLAPSNQRRGGKVIATKSGDRIQGARNRPQATKKAVISSLAAYPAADRRILNDKSSSVRGGKSRAPAKVTVIALAKTDIPKNKGIGKSKGSMKLEESDLTSVNAELGGINLSTSLTSINSSLASTSSSSSTPNANAVAATSKEKSNNGQSGK